MAIDKQRKTFLSYSRANQDFAKKLAIELKSEGFDVWLDQLDIPAGARWDREVENALRECEIFMIILTPSSVDSENVLDEIGYAIDNGKRFLPVLLENCDVPLRLRRFQYVDFTNKSFENGVASAKELLRDLVEQITIPREELSVDTQSQMAQAEAERKAKQDAERIAKKKADQELKAKSEEAQRSTKAAPAEMKTGAVPATPTQKKPPSKGLIFGGIAGVVVLVVAAVIGINAFSYSSDTEEPYVEAPAVTEAPAEPESQLDVSGTWTGQLDQDDRTFIMELILDESFYGRIIFDNGNENYEITDSYWDGYEFRFSESEGRYFWGTLENGHLIGFAAWDCYDCGYWGTFDLTFGELAGQEGPVVNGYNVSVVEYSGGAFVQTEDPQYWIEYAGDNTYYFIVQCREEEVVCLYDEDRGFNLYLDIVNMIIFTDEDVLYDIVYVEGQ